MLKLAIYGKGGIGKSTMTANLAAAFALSGKKVIQIGCDPKADSTINLLGGQALQPVMDYLRSHEDYPGDYREISREGFGGVLCLETGGPTPGLGCAGRGIIATFQLLEELELFEKIQPDVVLYAEKVLIVTSGEKMALYAANNIFTAVKNFEDRSYARVLGLILNHRDVDQETEKVQRFAKERGLEIVGEIERSGEIIRYEDMGKTVIEGDPSLPVSQTFLNLADRLWKIGGAG